MNKSYQDIVFNFTSRTRTCHEQWTTSWTNHVKNDEVLHRVKEERKIRCTVKQRKANWIGPTVHRNFMDSTTEGTWGQERRLQ